MIHKKSSILKNKKIIKKVKSNKKSRSQTKNNKTSRTNKKTRKTKLLKNKTSKKKTKTKNSKTKTNKNKNKKGGQGTITYTITLEDNTPNNNIRLTIEEFFEKLREELDINIEANNDKNAITMKKHKVINGQPIIKVTFPEFDNDKKKRR